MFARLAKNSHANTSRTVAWPVLATWSSHTWQTLKFLSKPHQGRRKVQRKPQTESRRGECAICCPPNCYLITAGFTIENLSRCRFDTNQCLGAYVFRILSADSACGFSTSTVGNFFPKILNVWFIMCGWWSASTLSCIKFFWIVAISKTQCSKLFALHLWNAHEPSMT